MLRKFVYPCFVVVLPFLMYIQLWHGRAHERMYLAGDLEDSYYPDLRVIELALFDGQFPLWNPYDRAGYPFAADPQPGVLYPLNWLLAAIGHLQGGVSLGLTHFKVLLHIAIAGLGMYLFMRERKQPEPAAAVAAVSYQFGAYFAPQIVFSLNWPLAWTPFLLRGLDRLFARPTPFAAFAVAGFMGLIVNAGSPPAVFYGALIAAPYFVLRLAESLRARPFKDWAVGPGRALLLAGGLGAIFSLPQLLATLVLTKESVLEKASFGHASSGSFIPEQLFSLAIRAMGPTQYEGICALFLACLGALYYRERKDTGLFLGMIVIGLFLMLGVNTQVFRLAYELIPGIDRFRLCFRYVILVSFGVSVLASYGVTALIERAVPMRLLRGFALAAVACLAFAAWMQSVRPDMLRDPWITRDFTTVGLLLGVAVALARGISLQGSSRSLLCAGMLGLLALDYAAFVPRADVQRFYDPYPNLLTAEEREQLRHDVSGYRVFNGFALNTLRAGSLDRFRDFSGYIDPLVLRRFSRVMFEQLKYQPARLMALYNVKYYLHSPHPMLQFERHWVPDPDRTPGFTRIKHNLYEVADPSPNAYWVGQIDLRPDQDAVLEELSHIDHHKAALVPSASLNEAQREWARGLRAPSREAVAAQVLGRGYNYATFEVQAPADGLLVLNEAWFPGWVVDVDGSSAPLLQVNGMMQGVRVTPGKHRVELRFRPYYFLIPAWIAVLSLLGALLYFARARFTRAAPAGRLA